jgi:hypothetical protein
LIAMAALVVELLVGRSESEDLDRTSSKRARRENPWGRDSKARLTIASGSERRRAGKMDPQAEYIADWVEETLNDHLNWAAEDWEDQQRVDQELRDADIDALERHAAELRRRTRGTQQRVLIEMLGFIFVLVGTLVASMAG